ncbi:mitochondrial 37S ribosomal protein bS6m ASCRUDRAFT_39467 [Ascoidea rubescens DSM 1968]|uniref:Ribosomal protein S6 n=1 Tax=Ascoidea rubescens DSM 1968 TaxID=1344418 RepID=A0A1D2V9U0_9ASCO|nr:hypothetical protein ASCRUDRAFT_39467 [Ascoidea rubescens DSM 1968]ODV58421.1 hypothetical protein ASCRUDRAFT_39467 [Ascoidea rubescens DSM 1968]
MLYELVALARSTSPYYTAASYKDAKDVAFNLGSLIIKNRGVVRDVYSLGVGSLPKRMRKNQEWYFQGAAFSILFDSSIGVQKEILRSLKLDPRILRSSIFRIKDGKGLTGQSFIDSVSKVQ